MTAEVSPSRGRPRRMISQPSRVLAPFVVSTSVPQPAAVYTRQSVCPDRFRHTCVHQSFICRVVGNRTYTHSSSDLTGTRRLSVRQPVISSASVGPCVNTAAPTSQRAGGAAGVLFSRRHLRGTLITTDLRRSFNRLKKVMKGFGRIRENKLAEGKNSTIHESDLEM